jgi:acetyl-CoA carboxylase biotin carboxyl carrier protein
VTRTSGSVFEETIASRIRPLAEAMQASDLIRVSVAEADLEIELMRHPRPAAAPAAVAADTAGSSASEATYEIVAADQVGIVRFTRPTAIEGTVLENDREIAYVEALGIRNPVRSKGKGRVASVFVIDGQAVEYGQPLFALDRGA